MRGNILNRIIKSGALTHPKISEQTDPLTKYPYLACFSFRPEKSLPIKVDTTVIYHRKCYLYATEYNGIRCCFYILLTSTLEAADLYEVKIRLSPTLFTGTLLEGHILDDNFIISDILALDGRPTKMLLQARLQKINNIIDHLYRPDPILDPFQLSIQDYVEYKYLRHFVTEYKDSLVYKNYINGLNFLPLDTCTTYIFMPMATISKFLEGHREMPKSKQLTIFPGVPRKTLMCFRIHKTDKPDVYHLYLADGGDIKYYDIASIPDKVTSNKVSGLLGARNTCIVNCQYDKIFGRWRPLKESYRTEPDDVCLLG